MLFGISILILSLIWNVAVIVFLLSVPVLHWISNNRLVKYLGEISFPIYLWNIPMFIWVQLINLQFGLELNYVNQIVYLSFIVVSVFVAVLSNEIIKRISKKIGV